MGKEPVTKMTGIDPAGVASWVTAALMGLGILWAVNEGVFKTQYSVGDVSISMDSVGILIFLAAIVLGGFHFVIGVSRKA